MWIVIFQILTILLLFLMTVEMFREQRKEQKKDREEPAGPVWEISCKRTGKSVSSFNNRLIRIRSRHTDKIEIPEGSYYLGGRFFKDDILVDLAQNSRLFLNVEPEQIQLAVLEGEIRIHGHVYGKDNATLIFVRDGTGVTVSDMHLTFTKTDQRGGGL